MPKTDKAHKNYFTPEIWEETRLREIFYGTLIFQQSSMIGIPIKIAPRALFFFLPSLPTTQSGFCGGERLSTKEA